MPLNRNERGKDLELIVNDQQIPITNFSIEGSYNVGESSWNDQEQIEKTYIEKNGSGSFEWDGAHTDARDAVLDDNGNPIKGRIQGRTADESLRARGVIVETYSREWPGDGLSSGTIDFTFEKLVIAR